MDGAFHFTLRNLSSSPFVCSLFLLCIIPNSAKGARRPLRQTLAKNKPIKDGSQHGYVKNKRQEGAVTHDKNWGESSAAPAEEE